MQVTVRKFTDADLPAMTAIWNGIVEEGNSFPQDRPFTEEEAREFFAAQSFTGVAEADGKVLGLYILHPNNAGRCGHIANASYGVSSGTRGLGVGEKLVRHSLEMCPACGFVGLQSTPSSVPTRRRSSSMNASGSSTSARRKTATASRTAATRTSSSSISRSSKTKSPLRP